MQPAPPRSLGGEPPQHIMEDSAGLEIFELVIGVDTAPGGEAQRASVSPGHLDLDFLPRLNVPDRVYAKFLAAVEADAGGAFPLAKLERKHAHADEIGAVNSLETL